MRTAVTVADVSTARGFAREVCAAHRDGPERCDDLLLVLSELIANACRHGVPPVLFDVVLDGDDLLVTVEDSSTTPPEAAPGPVSSAAEGGRGLLIVEQVSRRWGWEPTAGGKLVWARV